MIPSLCITIKLETKGFFFFTLFMNIHNLWSGVVYSFKDDTIVCTLPYMHGKEKDSLETSYLSLQQCYCSVLYRLLLKAIGCYLTIVYPGSD